MFVGASRLAAQPARPTKPASPAPRDRPTADATPADPTARPAPSGAASGRPAPATSAPREVRASDTAPNEDAPPKGEMKQAKPPESRGARTRGEVLDRILHFFDGFRLGALWYLHYRGGYDRTSDGRLDTYNDFRVSRGYFTVEVSPVKWFDSRFTMDTYQDDTGDWKVRVKYLYGKFILPVETPVVTEPYIKFGIVPMPWLAYEEHINHYRMQGTMFSERNKLYNSADLGLEAGVLLGRKLPARYRKEVSPYYPGTFGSISAGLYNGAGYHSIEKNMNKVVEARVSLRPLFWLHPNLQLSYFIIWGKGNLEEGNDIPAWENHSFMASYEHPYFVATAQYIMGRGVQKGEAQLWLDNNGNPVRYWGASGFLEIKLPWILSSLIGRYDLFDGPNASGVTKYHRIIGGWAFHFWGRNKRVLLLDFDYSILPNLKDRWAATLTLQVKL